MSEALEALLAVQELDTTADQLRHRRASMPERAALDALRTRITGVERDMAATQAERDEIAQREHKLEAEIAAVRAKADKDDKALYGGTVSALKDLRALQEEIESLQRRQRELEDQELELMEQAEPLDARLSELSSARSALDGDGAQLLAAITEAEVDIDRQLAELDGQRAAALAPVPADLLAEYERKRKAAGGIAVARLVGNRCEGCHLTLPAVEVDRIRHEPPGAVLHCSECDRILVR